MTEPVGPEIRLTHFLGTRWVNVGLLLVASALILPGLGEKDLWIDEADSVYFALHTWPALLLRLCDPHPPGYYALLKLAIGMFGASEFAVRLPSALASILTVAALVRLTIVLRAAQPRWVHVAFPLRLPAALLALAPLHVWYAQEARMYALVTLLGLGAAICAVRLARRTMPSDAVCYVISAATALLVDQSALVVLVPLALIGACIARRRALGALGQWLGLQIVALAPFALWWSRADAFAQISTGTLYPLTMTRLTLERWWIAIQARPWIAVAALCLAAFVAIVGTLAASRQRDAILASRAIGAALIIVCLYTVSTVVSVVPRLYTLKRIGVSLLPYALLITAYALVLLKAARRTYALVLSVSLGLSLITIWAIQKDPWRAALAAIEQVAAPADIVWVDEHAIPIHSYYRDGEARPWRANDLGAVAASMPVEGKLWLIAQANRYRNLLDYYPALDARLAIWSGSWPGIEIRAYDAAWLNADDLIPQSDIPDWLLSWPSPLDEACGAP
jgi:mannosyltransferase